MCLQWYGLSYCQPGIISWRPCWIGPIYDPADRQNSSSIVFPVSENILLCRHKIRVSTIFLRESVIICSELFNMGRIGNFFIFKPHFDNVPEFCRLYTFSMSQSTHRLSKNRWETSCCNLGGTTSVLTMIWIIILPAGDYFMAAMLDLRHLGPSGPTKFVFHRIPRIRKHICRHKIRGPTICLRESMIICSELFNMGRIGNFFTFKPHFDNVPEFPRL